MSDSKHDLKHEEVTVESYNHSRSQILDNLQTESGAARHPPELHNISIEEHPHYEALSQFMNHYTGELISEIAFIYNASSKRSSERKSLGACVSEAMMIQFERAAGDIVPLVGRPMMKTVNALLGIVARSAIRWVRTRDHKTHSQTESDDSSSTLNILDSAAKDTPDDALDTSCTTSFSNIIGPQAGRASLVSIAHFPRVDTLQGRARLGIDIEQIAIIVARQYEFLIAVMVGGGTTAHNVDGQLTLARTAALRTSRFMANMLPHLIKSATATIHPLADLYTVARGVMEGVSGCAVDARTNTPLPVQPQSIQAVENWAKNMTCEGALSRCGIAEFSAVDGYSYMHGIDKDNSNQLVRDAYTAFVLQDLGSHSMVVAAADGDDDAKDGSDTADIGTAVSNQVGLINLVADGGDPMPKYGYAVLDHMTMQLYSLLQREASSDSVFNSVDAPSVTSPGPLNAIWRKFLSMQMHQPFCQSDVDAYYAALASYSDHTTQHSAVPTFAVFLAKRRNLAHDLCLPYVPPGVSTKICFSSPLSASSVPVHFCCVDFSGATLSGTIDHHCFRSARFFRSQCTFDITAECADNASSTATVDFSKATMSCADLHGCCMAGADLSQTDLRYANLSGADLSGIRKLGTRWFGADINGIKENRPASSQPRLSDHIGRVQTAMEDAMSRLAEHDNKLQGMTELISGLTSMNLLESAQHLHRQVLDLTELTDSLELQMGEFTSRIGNTESQQDVVDEWLRDCTRRITCLDRNMEQAQNRLNRLEHELCTSQDTIQQHDDILRKHDSELLNYLTQMQTLQQHVSLHSVAIDEHRNRQVALEQEQQQQARILQALFRDRSRELDGDSDITHYSDDTHHDDGAAVHTTGCISPGTSQWLALVKYASMIRDQLETDILSEVKRSMPPERKVHESDYTEFLRVVMEDFTPTNHNSNNDGNVVYTHDRPFSYSFIQWLVRIAEHDDNIANQIEEKSTDICVSEIARLKAVHGVLLSCVDSLRVWSALHSARDDGSSSNVLSGIRPLFYSNQAWLYMLIKELRRSEERNSGRHHVSKTALSNLKSLAMVHCAHIIPDSVRTAFYVHSIPRRLRHVWIAMVKHFLQMNLQLNTDGDHADSVHCTVQSLLHAADAQGNRVRTSVHQYAWEDSLQHLLLTEDGTCDADGENKDWQIRFLGAQHHTDLNQWQALPQHLYEQLFVDRGNELWLRSQRLVDADSKHNDAAANVGGRHNVQRISSSASVHTIQAHSLSVCNVPLTSLMMQDAEDDEELKCPPMPEAIQANAQVQCRRYTDFYVKYFPEQVFTEGALRALDCRLFGGYNTVPISVVQLRRRDSSGDSGDSGTDQEIPLIASITPAISLSGAKPLWNVMNSENINDKKMLSSINKASFTRSLLRVLITCPEDDKPDDYWLVPMSPSLESKSGGDASRHVEYELIRIDNERAFFDPSDTTTKGSLLFSKTHGIVKSAVLCLTDMVKPDGIDSDVLEEVASLHAVPLLRTWLDSDVQHLHCEQALQAFGNAAVDMDGKAAADMIWSIFAMMKHTKGHLQNRIQNVYIPDAEDADFCLFVPCLPRKLVYNMAKRISSIGSTVRNHVQAKQLTDLSAQHQQQDVPAALTLSGLLLLHILNETRVVEDYGELLVKYKCAIDAWRAGPGKQYDNKHLSMTPHVASNKMLGHDLTQQHVRDICSGQANSFAMSLNEVAMFRFGQQVQPLVQEIMQCKGRMLFERAVIFEADKVEVMRQVLVHVQERSQHQTRGQDDAKQLQSFVVSLLPSVRWQHLSESLALSPLHGGLSDDLLSNVLRTSTTLLSLDVSGCNRLDGRYLQVLWAACPNLQVLRMCGNDRIESFVMDQPLFGQRRKLKNLHTLDMSGCEKLERVELNVPCLQYLNMSGCSVLQKLIVMMISKTQSWIKLTRIECDGCDWLDTMQIGPDTQKHCIGISDAVALTHILKEVVDCKSKELDWSGRGLKAAGITFIAATLPDSSLTSVNLCSNTIGSAGTSTIAAALPQSSLTQLQLDHNNIRAAGAYAIAAALPQSSLTQLDLRANNIGDTGASAIAEGLLHSSLTRLDLSHNEIGTVGASAIAAALPQSSLTQLDLSHNSIGTSAALPQRGLELLNFRRTGIGLDSAGVSAIAAALPHSSLMKLGIRVINIGAAEAHVIARALSQSSLTHLDLGSNNIGDDGASAIAEALPQSSLTHLILHDNDIWDYGASAIAEALPLSSLTQLDLRFNAMLGGRACNIATSLPQSSLTELNLGYNIIGDDGASAIAEALPQSSLTQLDLSANCVIGDDGASAIAAALPQSSLTHLDLYGNSIGDDGASAIAAVLPQSSLTQLTLGYNNIGSDGASAMASLLPQLSFTGGCTHDLSSSGTSAPALSTVTGNLWARLLSFKKAGHILGCFSSRSTGTGIEIFNENGFIHGRWYRILDVRKVDDHRVLQLSNPWGNNEWNGEWSDYDVNRWASSRYRNLLDYDERVNDSKFWMSLEDFLLNMERVWWCPVALQSDVRDNKYRKLTSKWEGRSAAGAPTPQNVKDPTTCTEWNPQFMLKSNHQSLVRISLTQRPVRMHASVPCEELKYPPIALFVIRKNSTSPYRIRAFDTSEVCGALEGDYFQCQQQVELEVWIESDKLYSVYACTLNPFVEMEFDVELFSLHEFDCDVVPLNAPVLPEVMGSTFFEL
jgi:Leucine-rich repeat (LRR) protein/predicted  nucleic acid-binding Zn-ribbon protein